VRSSGGGLPTAPFLCHAWVKLYQLLPIHARSASSPGSYDGRSIRAHGLPGRQSSNFLRVHSAQTSAGRVSQSPYNRSHIHGSGGSILVSRPGSVFVSAEDQAARPLSDCFFKHPCRRDTLQQVHALTHPAEGGAARAAEQRRAEAEELLSAIAAEEEQEPG
jgi:hypothetical protein